MSATLSIMDSLAFVVTLLKNQRLDINNLQPGLGMANNVLGTMLGPPFIWRTNRSSFQLAITQAGGTDYSLLVADLGRIETQWLTSDAGDIFELKGAQSLARVSAKRRPMEVAPVYDDGSGNVTLRFNAVPDRNYTAWFDYQRRAPKVTSFAQTFAPVEDEFAFLFNKGLLSEGALAVNDSRFTIWRREWVAGVLATQDGLDEQAKAIFFEQMMNQGRTAVRSQAAGQSGSAGRGI